MRTIHGLLVLTVLAIGLTFVFAATEPTSPAPQAALAAPEDVAVYTLEIADAPIN